MKINDVEKINLSDNIIITGKNEDIQIVLKTLNKQSVLLPSPTIYYKDLMTEFEEKVITESWTVQTNNLELIDSLLKTNYEFKIVRVENFQNELYLRVFSKKKAYKMRYENGLELR
jgi:hypothetical protein